MSKHQTEEKVVYVGDSRVKKNTKTYHPTDYSAYPGKSEAFVPNFLLKEWMVGAVIAVGFMALVISHPAPLGYPADPLNAAFIPMPDWYFLFMYQLLKYPYMSDQFVVLGTVVFPGLLFGGLMLAPFLDRGKERKFYKRPVASALVLLSVAAVVHLTYVSWSHYQNELVRLDIVPEHIERAQIIAAGKEPPRVDRGSSNAPEIPIVEADSEGFNIYQRSSCVACHSDDLKGQSGAGIPGLLAVGDLYSKEELMTIIKDGIPPKMPPQYEQNINAGLTDEELDTLAEWLALQKAPVEQ